MKQEPVEKRPPAGGFNFLLAWQGIEIFLMIAFFAVTFLIVAFSGDKKILAIWSVLWKVMVVKAIVMFFFIKKKKWTILFNLAESAATLLFLVYAVFYTLIKGDPAHWPARLTLVLIILLGGAFYAFLIKSFYHYFKFLK